MSCVLFLTEGTGVKIFCISFFVFLVSLVFLKRYLYGTSYNGTSRLDGKTVIITGGNTGIGKEVARNMAKRGARVILACRDLSKARKAADEIKRTLTDEVQVVVKQLDLASLKSVRNFSEEIIETEKRLDILINNAGVFYCPFLKTEDGFEMQFGVNHLGHFLLTNLLLDLLKKSTPSRIVTVSSDAHEMGSINFDDLNSEKKYDQRESYNQSKLANVLFSRELSKRLEGTNVTTYSLHPGVARTDISRHMWTSRPLMRPFIYLYLLLPLFKDCEQGAQTVIYCAVEASLEKETGKYYSECRETVPCKMALDDGVAKKLWEVSERMVNLPSQLKL